MTVDLDIERRTLHLFRTLLDFAPVARAGLETPAAP
jgi:hypothetical protein